MIKAKKRYGQNFIIDKNTVEAIAEKSNTNSKTTVIEIGPGLGALTKELAIRSKKVIAFEIDQDLVLSLKTILAEYTNVEVIKADILKVDLDPYLEKEERIVVSANLPYYITTPILFHLFDYGNYFSQITVMMQKEVALRLLAKPSTKEYNALSIIVQYKYDVKQVLKVSRNVFKPKPEVDSVVISFNQKPVKKNIDEEKFFKLVQSCFKQRRKTIENNLKLILDKDTVIKILKIANIDSQARAESLSLDDYLRLFEVGHEEKIICKN